MQTLRSARIGYAASAAAANLPPTATNLVTVDLLEKHCLRRSVTTLTNDCISCNSVFVVTCKVTIPQIMHPINGLKVKMAAQ